MKQKVLTIALLVLMSTALLFIVNAPVKGQTLGLYIYEVTRQNSFTAIQNASVGTPVTLVGTVYTVNGTYDVYFGDKLVETGTAQQHYVASNFTIPEVLGGNYNLTLADISLGQNYTYPFPILTEYSAKPIIPSSPAQLQEGQNIVLNVTITGGDASTAYGADITIVQPSPLSANFTRSVSLTTSSLGTAQMQINFPDTTFSPSGSNTLYAGTYTVYFNQSQSLAQNTFTVGFTDLTTYHRGETVKINAVGYQPTQSATLAIQYNNGVIFSQAVTASGQGVIAFSWSVPNDAAIGTYTATIAPQTTPSKTIADVQTFQLPGYPITFTAKNLAGKVVPDILLEVLDQASGNYYNQTTYLDGTAIINLEKGNQTVDAYWNQVRVGEAKISVTGNSSYTINCQLTDLKIKVQDKNGVPIPFANLNLTYQYTTRTGSTQTGATVGQTDLSGVYTFNSTLPGIVYTVTAEKYDMVFNAGNNTIGNVPTQASTQATIICPEETLGLRIVDYNNNAIPSIRLALIEQASGIFYSLTTDNNGAAQTQVTFGQYRLSVYTADNVLLNETVINVLSNTQSQIRCVAYNLKVTVKVVDYFGTPISNINVQISRPGMNTQTATTAGDGIATFNNVIGGDMEIVGYPTGNQNSFVATNLQVTSPTTTVILDMNKYVVFGGALVDASLLASVAIILLVAALLIILETYRRTGFRLRRSSA